MKPSPATALTAAAVLAVLAACGGSPSSTGSGRAGSTNDQLLAFGHCMRSNGVPNFPDPTTDAKFPGAQQLGVSDSQYQAALNACRHLLPNGGNGPNQGAMQQQMTALLPFARCMRSHGAPNWPDPSIRSNDTGAQAVVFYLVGLPALDGNGFDSPQVQGAIQQCSHLLPPSNGGPPFRIMRGQR